MGAVYCEYERPRQKQEDKSDIVYLKSKKNRLINVVHKQDSRKYKSKWGDHLILDGTLYQSLHSIDQSFIAVS